MLKSHDTRREETNASDDLSTELGTVHMRLDIAAEQQSKNHNMLCSDVFTGSYMCMYSENKKGRKKERLMELIFLS